MLNSPRIMATRPCLLFVFYLTIPLVFAGCEEDTTELNRAALQGRWELTKGFRNKQATATLSGIYYEFDPAGKMKTNLPVVQEVFMDYELKRNTLVQKSAKPVNYQIIQLNDSTLVLSTELRGIPFELHLHKMSPPPDTLNVPQIDSVR